MPPPSGSTTPSTTPSEGTTVNVAVSLFRITVYYSATLVGGTARLGYAATDLTPVSTTSAGSGLMTNSNLVPNAWIAVLGTNIAALSGVPMTHRGSYRVWARVQSPTQPQVRFIWGVGSLAAPTFNDAVTLGPGVGSRQLVDLGEIRLDAPPLGPMQWYGAIQAMPDAGGTTISIDHLLFQPLDDGGGRLLYNANVPPSLIAAGPNGPTTYGTATSSGTIAWSHPGGTVLQASLPTNSTTQLVTFSGYGFAIPSIATILGVSLAVHKVAPFGGPVTTDSFVRLQIGGATLGLDRSAPAVWSTSVNSVYGGQGDLWGATLNPATVNSSTFGGEFQAQSTPAGTTGTIQIDTLAMTVYYTLTTGIATPGDAVIYAASAVPNAVNVEMRTEGMFRNDPAGAVYGEVSRIIGDLPRLPVSGLENRPIEVFVRLSSGDLTPGLVDVIGPVVGQIQPFYRPSYLFPP